MADTLDPEQTQEESLPAVTPEPIQAQTPPVQTSTSLDEFLYGDQPEQAQPEQAQPMGGLDEFLYGSKQEQDAISQKIPVAQHFIAVRDDPAAIDPISALARKIKEPAKSEAAWADYQNNMLSYGPDIEEQFKQANEKNDWQGMAGASLRMIGKEWGDYISAMLGLTNEDRKKNQESFGAQMAIGKITDPKDAATALQLQEDFERLHWLYPSIKLSYLF